MLFLSLRHYSEDEFLVIACDGLWDVFSSQNAIDFARMALRRHNDPEQMARDLVAEAVRRDSSDNVSAVCVCFQQDAPPSASALNKRVAPPNALLARSISLDGKAVQVEHISLTLG